MTRNEFLKSKGFRYDEENKQRILGYYELTSYVYVLDFNNKNNTRLHITSFCIYLDNDNSKDVNSSLTHSIKFLKDIYEQASKLKEE